MSEETYVVVRSSSPIVPGSGDLMARAAGAGPFAGPAAEPVAIEEMKLDKKDTRELRRDPRTRAMARAMPMKLIEPVETEDAQPAAGSTWGIKAVGAPGSPFDGQGITVAVLDTGIDPNHPAFQGVDLVQRNFTQGGDDDEHGHGTHCAGTIFGQDVDGTRIGVARNVDRALIGKVLGPGGGSSSTIVQAIQWAVAEGAHVISMSLGIDFPGFVDELVNVHGIDAIPATSIALEQYRANVNLFTAVAEAVHAGGLLGRGTVLVAASGNESARPTFEVAAGPPAAGTGMISVGALGEGQDGLTVARFSNNQVDVSGPGVEVLSAARGGGLVSMSGTSMATPHAAGVAALWAQRQLESAGRVESQSLTAKLIGFSQTALLASGFEEEDVGTGIVQAPSN